MQYPYKRLDVTHMNTIWIINQLFDLITTGYRKVLIQNGDLQVTINSAAELRTFYDGYSWALEKKVARQLKTQRTAGLPDLTDVRVDVKEIRGRVQELLDLINKGVKDEQSD